MSRPIASRAEALAAIAELRKSIQPAPVERGPALDRWAARALAERLRCAADCGTIESVRRWLVRLSIDPVALQEALRDGRDPSRESYEYLADAVARGRNIVGLP